MPPKAMTSLCHPATANQFDGLRQALHKDRGDSRVFVDFDYTLFLANSTDEFLECARPAFLAALLLRVLGLLKPWSFLPGERRSFVWRDPIRVLAVVILMPWTLLLFRRRAHAIFERHYNRALAPLLAEVGADRVVIVSFGYSFVIRRLIVGTPLEGASVIASSMLDASRFRREGKASRLFGKRVAADATRDIFVTDSEVDDADVLARFEQGFHIRWTATKKPRPHDKVYVPFFYTDVVKRPGQGFFIRTILLDEFALVAFCFLLYQPLHWSIWICAFSLFLAFRLTYEIGYVENDRVGFLYEASPKLSKEYYRYKDYRVTPYAWYWAVALTFFGIFVLDAEFVLASVTRLGFDPEIGTTAARSVLVAGWLALIGVARSIFFLFNHAPLIWRIAIFYPLHLVKYFAPALIFASGPAGLALLFGQITRTWTKYAIRRSDGDRQLFPGHLIRMMFFFSLLGVFGLVMGFGAVFGAWQTYAIMAWCVVRGIPDVRRTFFKRSAPSRTTLRESPRAEAALGQGG